MKDKLVCYICREGQAREEPREVCAFLWDYFQTIPDDVTAMHLCSDRYLDQNKDYFF